MVWMKHWLAPQAFFKLKAKDHITAMDTVRHLESCEFAFGRVF
jgi:hypothetical protein